jgi:tetratricopeptide (TPR) repeat protein
VQPRDKRKVLLIGWEGARWSSIHPLLDTGAMPALAHMVESGVMGELAGLPVPCPPLLWTTLATGQLPDKHGILDSVESDPRSGGVRRVTRASLRAVPVWEILAREGLRCQTIGWSATHPAGSLTTCVSDGFAYGIPQSISPADLEPVIAPLRFQPQEWTGNDLQLFVPELSRIDQDKDKRLAKLAVILAEAASIHAATTALLERADWDFTAVRFPTIAQAAEPFRDDEDGLYGEVLTGVHRFLDLFLATLLRVVGEDAVIMLVSECAAEGGRGILCASGKGIEADELTFGASLLDVAPTLLSLFGFAPAPGMSGSPIRDLCPAGELQAIHPGYLVPPPAPPVPPEFDRDLLDLAAMGYTDHIAPNLLAEAETARKRRDLHLARVLLATGRAAEAISPLERLAALDPANFEVRFYLGHAYFRSGRIAECRTLCEALLAESPDSPLGPLVCAHLAVADGRYADARAHLDSSRSTHGVTAALDAAIGEAYLRIGEWREAAEVFRSAIAADPGIAAAHQGLAQALFEQHLFDQSAEAALDAIRLRYDAPVPHRILGHCLRALGREEAAAQEFAVAQRVSGPRAL